MKNFSFRTAFSFVSFFLNLAAPDTLFFTRRNERIFRLFFHATLTGTFEITKSSKSKRTIPILKFQKSSAKILHILFHPSLRNKFATTLGNTHNSLLILVRTNWSASGVGVTPTSTLQTMQFFAVITQPQITILDYQPSGL